MRCKMVWSEANEWGICETMPLFVIPCSLLLAPCLLVRCSPQKAGMRHIRIFFLSRKELVEYSTKRQFNKMNGQWPMTGEPVSESHLLYSKQLFRKKKSCWVYFVHFLCFTHIFKANEETWERERERERGKSNFPTMTCYTTSYL